jgi:hypothetical protein
MMTLIARQDDAGYHLVVAGAELLRPVSGLGGRPTLPLKGKSLVPVHCLSSVGDFRVYGLGFGGCQTWDSRST